VLCSVVLCCAVQCWDVLSCPVLCGAVLCCVLVYVVFGLIYTTYECTCIFYYMYTCVSGLPCQHWCSRNGYDRNKCLWAAWAASTPTGSFFFGGDSGYCSSIFQKIGRVVNPQITVAALPIGAYGSPSEQWFHHANHMNPAEAVKTHLDLRAKCSLAIHWGTFQLVFIA
jgi:hypothetical protein